MEWLALLTPVLLSILALLIWKNKIVWFEVVIPICISMVIIMVMKWSMVKSLVADTEYTSAFITKAEHIDEWDEWIQKTCSYTTSHGSGKYRYTTTHYYDCSYVDNHPEEWTASTNVGQSFSIQEKYYNNIVRLFKNESFVEMHRDYHSIDGDAHVTEWPSTFVDIIPIDASNSYDNKVQTAETVFHFDNIDSIKQKTVYEYPPIIESKQKACIGCTDTDNHILRNINALYGASKQIKIFVLIFKNRTESIAEVQRQFWKGGNKNELVICVDSKNQWAKSFSWSDDKLLESKVNQLFMNDKLSIRQKLLEVKRLVPITWKRKQFKDFDYIDVMLTDNQLLLIHIITFIVSCIFILWGITNGINQDTFDPMDGTKNHRRY